MDNIDFFNRFTLTFLEKLYSEFPEPIEVDFRAMAFSILPEELNEEESFRLGSKASSAVRFLVEEGFIRAQENHNIDDDDFYDFRLSAKGLSVLNSTPDSLNPQESLISKVRTVIENGAKNAAVDAVKTVAQMLFAASIAAATS